MTPRWKIAADNARLLAARAASMSVARSSPEIIANAWTAAADAWEVASDALEESLMRQTSDDAKNSMRASRTAAREALEKRFLLERGYMHEADGAFLTNASYQRMSAEAHEVLSYVRTQLPAQEIHVDEDERAIDLLIDDSDPNDPHETLRIYAEPSDLYKLQGALEKGELASRERRRRP